jgi:hypothetical protein
MDSAARSYLVQRQLGLCLLYGLAMAPRRTHQCMTSSKYPTLPRTFAWVTEFSWHEWQKLCCLETIFHGYRFCAEQLNVVTQCQKPHNLYFSRNNVEFIAFLRLINWYKSIELSLCLISKPWRFFYVASRSSIHLIGGWVGPMTVFWWQWWPREKSLLFTGN